MKFFVLIIVSFGLISCAAYRGTGTGNPVNAPASEKKSTSVSVRDVLCEKLLSCYSSMPINQCKDVIYNSSGYAIRLGYDDPAVLSLSQLNEVEVAGAVTPDLEALGKCLTFMNDLSCDSAIIFNSYKAEAQQPFLGALQMLTQQEGYCPAVFKH